MTTYYIVTLSLASAALLLSAARDIKRNRRRGRPWYGREVRVR